MASSYRVFKWLAIVQLLVTVAMPLIWPELDTILWLVSFTLFAFWLANYALVRMAFLHNPDQKGLSGWINRMWENLLFLSWLGLLISIVILFIKLAAFKLS
jgi:hypothetical protein